MPARQNPQMRVKDFITGFSPAYEQMRILMKYFFLCILVVFTGQAFAAGSADSADHLHGSVFGLELNGARQDTVPLTAANIYWRDMPIGTTADENGFFHVDRPDAESAYLIFNHAGFKNDTLFVNPDDNDLVVYLKTLQTMEEIHVSADKPNSFHK